MIMSECHLILLICFAVFLLFSVLLLSCKVLTLLSMMRREYEMEILQKQQHGQGGGGGRCLETGLRNNNE